jgi:hypothetical protein
MTLSIKSALRQVLSFLQNNMTATYRSSVCLFVYAFLQSHDCNAHITRSLALIAAYYELDIVVVTAIDLINP